MERAGGSSSAAATHHGLHSAPPHPTHAPPRISTLNALAAKVPDDDACKALVAKNLAGDSSKRPQSNVVDIPREILGKYVFVPTQKFLDGEWPISIYVP